MDVLLAPLVSDDPLATLAVIPVVVGPLQALLAMLPGILVALGSLIVAMFKPSAIKRFLHLLWSQKVIVAGIAVAVWGLIYLWGILFPAVPDAVAGATSQGDAQWSLWRGGLERRGFVAGAEDPGHGNVVWAFSRGGIKDFYASPGIVGNRLYITSAQPAFYGEGKGAIYSIDVESGKLPWSFDASGYRPTFSSPSVWGKYVVVGEGLHDTRNARVFCLDKEASEQKREGVKLWEYATKSHVESSPCIAEGRAYIGAGDDGLYCFELEPDDQGNARLVWHLEGKDYPDCETAPIVHDGKVYFGLGNGGQAICCVDAADGKELWRVETPYPVFSSPSISGGKLYAGMGIGDFVFSAEDLAKKRRDQLSGEGKTPEEIEKAIAHIVPAGEVWCIDLEKHEPDWKFKADRTVLGAVAVDGDRLYFNSRGGMVYCISTGGKPLGKWNAYAPILASPAVGERHVYVVTERGLLYGLDKMDLSLVWEASLGSPAYSSPVVALGHVYVGTKGSGLLCVGEPGREKEPPLWAGPLGGPGKAGLTDGSLLPAQGAFAWDYTDPLEGVGENPPPLDMLAPAAYAEGALYVGLSQKGVAGLARLTVGDKTGDKGTRQWFVPSKNPIHLSAAVAGNAVYFVDGQAGDQGRILRCLDAAGGELRSEYPVSDDAPGEFAVTRDMLYIADTADGLTCLDNQFAVPGKTLWRATVGPCVGTPAAGDDVVLVAVKSPPKLVALDRRTGIPRWIQPLASEPLAGAVIAAGRAWIGQDDGVRSFALEDGKELGTVACPAPVSPLVFGGGHLACVTQEGKLILIDPAEGKQVGVVEGVVGTFPPLVGEDALLYLANGSIQRYEFGTGKSQQWTRIRPTWPGNLVTPMIAADSHVFFATDKRGFICMKPKKQ